MDYAIAGSATNYIEAGTATDYTTALASANTFFASNNTFDYYVVQLSDGVVVFSGAAAGTVVEDAIVLVGRTLSDIEFGNII